MGIPRNTTRVSGVHEGVHGRIEVVEQKMLLIREKFHQKMN